MASTSSARSLVLWGIVGAGLLAAFRLGFTDDYFYNADAYDFAQMGRQLAEGEGFTTLQTFPRHLVYFRSEGLDPAGPWPILHRYPLPVAAAGCFQLLLGDPVVAGIVRSGVFFVLGVVLLGICAARLTSLSVGIGLCLLLASQRELWQDAYSGMVDSQGSAFLVLFLLVVLFASRTFRGGVLVGIAAAALYLTKTQFVGGLPVAFVLLALQPERKRLLAGFVLGAVVTIAPWMVRNALWTGDPTFSFLTTRNLALGVVRVGSDFDMRIDVPLTLVELVRDHGAAIGAKFLASLRQHAVQPIQGSVLYSVLACSLLLGLLPAGKLLSNPRHVLFVRLIAGLVLFHVLAECLAHPNPRFSYAYRGPLLLAAVLLIQAGIERIPRLGRRFRRLLVPVLLVLVTLPGYASLFGGGPGPTFTAPRLPVDELVAASSPDALIASDVSYAIALECRRRSVRLPIFPEDLLTLDRDVRPIDFVFVSRFVPGDARRTKPRPTLFATYGHYGSFLREPVFLERFELVRRFSDGARLYRRRPEEPR